MRTNIVIDDELMEAAMKAGPFKTKKQAVEAGLKLLARQAAFRDLLALRGKLHWDDGQGFAKGVMAQQRRAAYKVSAANPSAKRKP